MANEVAVEVVRRPGRQPAPTDSIRAPELTAKRVKKIAQLRNVNVSEYVESRFGPLVEEDWFALPDGVREYLEKHLDD